MSLTLRRRVSPLSRGQAFSCVGSLYEYELCRSGGIGRHAVLRGQWRKSCRFESGLRHQSSLCELRSHDYAWASQFKNVRSTMFWGKLGTFILSIFLIWWLWRMYKTQPEFFSGKNISKSFTTMGILALLLISFIALVVVYLRH